MNYDQLIDWVACNAEFNQPDGLYEEWSHENWEDWLRLILPEELLMQWGDYHAARIIKEAFPEAYEES